MPVGEEASALIASSGEGPAAVFVARSRRFVMNPASSVRLAMVDAMAGMAALSPLETPDSDSPVCRDNAETIAGETKFRKLSISVAIKPSHARRVDVRRVFWWRFTSPPQF
jgi:hypothetical protein